MSHFLVVAVRTFVDTIQRRAIDRAFACMENDVAYHEEAMVIVRQFEQSDWEVWEIHGSSSHLG
jgi:hypothetical protein